jgi:hypothetical protein
MSSDGNRGLPETRTVVVGSPGLQIGAFTTQDMNLDYQNRLRETRLPGRLDQSFKGLEMIATAAVAVAQTPQSMEIAEPACQWDKPDPVSPRGTHGAIGGRGADTAHDEYRHFDPERKSSRRSRPKPFTSTKKGARIFTPEQQQVLKAVYAENQYPSRDDIQRLARAFQQPEAKLTTWFNNRRARVRRSQRNQRVSPSTRRYGSEQSATALSSQSMERCASECVTSATGHQTVPLARKSSRRESIFDTESTALAAHAPWVHSPSQSLMNPSGRLDALNAPSHSVCGDGSCKRQMVSQFEAGESCRTPAVSRERRTLTSMDYLECATLRGIEKFENGSGRALKSDEDFSPTTLATADTPGKWPTCRR